MKLLETMSKMSQMDLKGVNYEKDLYSAVDGADAVVIMTEWNEYRAIDTV